MYDRVTLYILLDFQKNLYTPMHIAAIKGYINIGLILAGHGCRLNIRDVNHMTPLHRAALYNRVDFIKFLIKKVRFF